MNKETLFRIAIGSIMVLFGLLIILVPSFTVNLWLLFVWVPAIFMEYRAATGGDKGLFVPGGILLVVSLILTLNVIFPNFIAAGGWALFIMAPAVGLFQLFIAEEKKDSGLLFAASLLAAISAFFVLMNVAPKALGIFVGLVLLAIGVLVVFKNIRSTKR